MPLAALGGILAGAGTGAGAAAATAGAWTALGAGAAAGTSIYGAKKQSGAAKNALNYQSQSDQQAMQMEQQRVAEEKRQFDVQQQNLADQQLYQRGQDAQAHQLSQNQFDFTKQQYTDREARLQPFRQASGQALGRLSDLIGLNGQQPQRQWLSPSNAGRGTMADLVRR